MWQSITNIHKPDSLEEAVLLSGPDSVYIAGGSYLNLEKNVNISTLVDINNLIDNGIETYGEVFKIGAKTSLEKVAGYFSNEISDCSRWSCCSKNVRNQRTIGGEISRKRMDSDLYILFSAMDVQLDVFNGKQTSVLLSRWDGRGIITQVRISQSDIDSTAIERYSLLPSASSYLITASKKSPDSIRFIIGGKVKKVTIFGIPYPGEEAEIRKVTDKASESFLNDHFGSVAYKKSLLNTAMERLRKRQW